MTKKHTAKHLFLSLLFLITNFYLYASSSLSFSITGKVIDENKEPIPCVSVAVYKSDQLITGCITNDKGVFTLKVEQSGNEIVLQ